MESNSFSTMSLFECINWYINLRNKAHNVCYWFAETQRVQAHKHQHSET